MSVPVYSRMDVATAARNGSSSATNATGHKLTFRCSLFLPPPLVAPPAKDDCEPRKPFSSHFPPRACRHVSCDQVPYNGSPRPLPSNVVVAGLFRHLCSTRHGQAASGFLDIPILYPSGTQNGENLVVSALSISNPESFSCPMCEFSALLVHERICFRRLKSGSPI